MNAKERLEEAKGKDWSDLTISQVVLVDWLIQQAEEKQELENEANLLLSEIAKIRDVVLSDCERNSQSLYDKWLGSVIGDPYEVIGFVEEYVKEKQELERHRETDSKVIEILEQQSSQYKQALEFYADENNYVVWNSMVTKHEEIKRDGGYKARQALQNK